MPTLVQNRARRLTLMYPDGGGVDLSFDEIERLAVRSYAGKASGHKWAVYIVTKAGQSHFYASRPERMAIEKVAEDLAEQVGVSVARA